MRKLAIWAAGLLLIAGATTILGAGTLSGNQEDPLNKCGERVNDDGSRATICLVFDPQEKVATAPINTVHELTVKGVVTTWINPDGSEADGFPAPLQCTATAPDGQPANLELRLWVFSGPNKGTESHGICDEHGRFTMSYPGDSGPGRDLILACIYAPNYTPVPCLDPFPARPSIPPRPGPLSTAEVTWIDATPAPPTAKPTVTPPVPGGNCYTLPAGGKEETWCISLDPETSSRAMGTEHALTAIVTLDGSAQSGQIVALEITTGPNARKLVAPKEGTTIQVTETSAGGNTGTDGRTALFYVGSGGLGTDTIRACRTTLVAPYGCTSVVDEATVQWTEAPAGALGEQQGPQPGGQTRGTGGSPNQLQGGPDSGIGSLAPLPTGIPVWSPVAGVIAAMGLLVAFTLVWRSRLRGRGRAPARRVSG
jgi:hypothetical protein